MVRSGWNDAYPPCTTLITLFLSFFLTPSHSILQLNFYVVNRNHNTDTPLFLPFHSIPFHSIPFHSIPFHHYSILTSPLLSCPNTSCLSCVCVSPRLVYYITTSHITLLLHLIALNAPSFILSLTLPPPPPFLSPPHQPPPIFPFPSFHIIPSDIQ